MRGIRGVLSNRRAKAIDERCARVLAVDSPTHARLFLCEVVPLPEKLRISSEEGLLVRGCHWAEIMTISFHFKSNSRTFALKTNVAVDGGTVPSWSHTGRFDRREVSRRELVGAPHRYDAHVEHSRQWRCRRQLPRSRHCEPIHHGLIGVSNVWTRQSHAHDRGLGIAACRPLARSVMVLPLVGSTGATT